LNLPLPSIECALGRLIVPSIVPTVQPNLLLLRSIYTPQLFPKTVACKLLTTWIVLCESNTQLAYVVVSELCAWFTQYNSSCKQVACDSFGQKLWSINRPLKVNFLHFSLVNIANISVC
jgi:hypothetical protein